MSLILDKEQQAHKKVLQELLEERTARQLAQKTLANVASSAPPLTARTSCDVQVRPSALCPRVRFHQMPKDQIMLCHVASCVHSVHRDQPEPLPCCVVCFVCAIRVALHCTTPSPASPGWHALLRHPLRATALVRLCMRGLGVFAIRTNQIRNHVIRPSASAHMRGRIATQAVLKGLRGITALDPDAPLSLCRQHCSGMHRTRAGD